MCLMEARTGTPKSLHETDGKNIIGWTATFESLNSTCNYYLTSKSEKNVCRTLSSNESPQDGFGAASILEVPCNSGCVKNSSRMVLAVAP